VPSAAGARTSQAALLAILASLAGAFDGLIATNRWNAVFEVTDRCSMAEIVKVDDRGEDLPELRDWKWKGKS
jgi:hypothetical protein